MIFWRMLLSKWPLFGTFLPVWMNSDVMKIKCFCRDKVKWAAESSFGPDWQWISMAGTGTISFFAGRLGSGSPADETQLSYSWQPTNSPLRGERARLWLGSLWGGFFYYIDFLVLEIFCNSTIFRWSESFWSYLVVWVEC